MANLDGSAFFDIGSLMAGDDFIDDGFAITQGYSFKMEASFNIIADSNSTIFQQEDPNSDNIKKILSNTNLILSDK